MDLGLKGKVAIVTGAGRGIGRVVAKTFAQEGANVVVAEINEPSGQEAVKELESLGVGSLFVKTDISDLESTKRMAGATKDKFGKIDILVNNATIMAPAKFFMEESLDDIDREINIIYRGYLYCIRSVLEHMIPQQSGCILSFLSDSARVGEARMVNYGATKAAVGGMSRGLAKEVGLYHIRVNCVSPSMTLTELGKERREIEKKQLGEEKFAELQKKRVSFYPIGRLGEPQDLANMVVFLCSERASWVTGQTVSVNGGYAIGPW